MVSYLIRTTYYHSPIGRSPARPTNDTIWYLPYRTIWYTLVRYTPMEVPLVAWLSQIMTTCKSRHGRTAAAETPGAARTNSTKKKKCGSVWGDKRSNSHFRNPDIIERGDCKGYCEMTDRVMMTNLSAHSLQHFPRTATRTSTTTTTMGDGAVDQGNGARGGIDPTTGSNAGWPGETDEVRLVGVLEAPGPWRGGRLPRTATRAQQRRRWETGRGKALTRRPA
jgi:hypothetical protein